MKAPLRPAAACTLYGLLAGLLALTHCRPARMGIPHTDGLDKGRALYALLADGKGDSLYARLAPPFQRAVNGREGFQALMRQLPQELGIETGVDTEAVFLEAGLTSYYRISRFEKNPSVTTRFVWNDSAIQGLTVRPTATPAPTSYLDYHTKTPLRLPFRDTWYVAWGGRVPHLNYHVAAPDQRFAYDFIYAKAGKISKDAPRQNEDYYGFGQPVLAPGAGHVLVAVDSVADNRPGTVNRRSPPGNYIIIDHGNGEYSLLAHFRRGTVAVKAGDTVRSGDLLGQCGNSGQSTLPHLHFHLQTGKQYQQGLGLPAFFEDYEANGTKVKRGEPVRGEYVSERR